MGKILGSLSEFNVSMDKIKKKFWEIFEKILRHLESFTFTLFLNLLFIIVPEGSCSRLTGFSFSAISVFLSYEKYTNSLFFTCEETKAKVKKWNS